MLKEELYKLQVMYFKILIIAFGILALFRILSFLNKLIPFSKGFKHYSGYLLPVAELAVWLGFLIWCARIMYESEAYMTLVVFGVVFVLIFAPGWFLVRDFLFGMLLKIQRKIEVDSKIEIGEIKGIILKTDYFTFDVKTAEGDIDTIPYNKIRSKVISTISANKYLEKQLVSFRFPSSQDISKIIPELKTTLINAPWVVASHEPIISSVVEEGGKNRVEVFVYMMKKEHTDKIIEYVNLNFISKIIG